MLRIRNTVGDAIETYDRLSQEHDCIELFHARYAQIDRQQREGEVLARYGLKGGPEQRRGWLLVATQVVEQSLDLDFDLIVSDIAPVDLLIQRAGRLWRHARPDRAPSACQELVVVTPEPVTEPTARWLPSAFMRTAGVYQDVTSLWLTARATARRPVRRMPRRPAPAYSRPCMERRLARNLPEGIVASQRRSEAARSDATGDGGSWPPLAAAKWLRAGADVGGR